MIYANDGVHWGHSTCSLLSRAGSGTITELKQYLGGITSQNHADMDFVPLQDVKVQFIAAGSASCHCIIGDVEGRCYTWGRNEVRNVKCYLKHQHVHAPQVKCLTLELFCGCRKDS